MDLSEYRVVAGAEVPPFRTALTQEPVAVTGLAVTAGGEDVVITNKVTETQLREFFYVTVKDYTRAK